MFEQGTELKKIHGAGNVFDFTLGNPDPEPPAAFTAALRRILDDPTPGKHRYMPNVGYPEVRAAIADHVSQDQGVTVTADQVIMTVGAASALNVALRALLNPGDEVIVLAPYFVEYLFYVENHGGIVRIVETRKDFGLDLEALGQALGPRTKAIILNSPNNPTGVCYPEQDLTRLAGLLEDHEKSGGQAVYVISDDPYRRLIFDDLKPTPWLRLFKNGLFATSHAKDLSIPGERIGYLVLAPTCADLPAVTGACAFCIRTLGFVNAPALMQRAVASLQKVSIDVDGYRRRRDHFFDGLIQAGYRCTRPSGAFYLFPESPIPDDVEMINKLMDYNILAVPGSGFGRKGYFRLSYCVGEETIQRALPGLAEARAALG